MKKYEDIQSAVKQIGPVKAAALLAGNSNYRKMSIARRDTYARLMTNGQWKLSILLFDKDGNLVDGQTRLAAVVKTGLAQWFVCISSWPREEEIAVDNGQNRSRSQVAQAERGVSNASLRLAMATGIEHITEGVYPMTNLEALACYDKHEPIIEKVCSLLRKPMSTSVIGIPFCRALLARPEDETKIIEALEKLMSLEFASARMSGLKLFYQWAVVRRFAAGGTKFRAETYLRCARALEAYLNDERIGKLYLPKSDPFPFKEEEAS